MNIKIIAVGKIKEKYLTNGINEYFKRLTKYCKVQMIEVGDEKIPEKASEKQEEEVKQREGDRILSHVKSDSFVTALCLEGKMLDSVELSELIQGLAVRGKSSITFIIGGSLGLSDKVKKRADLQLSFSRMTFPHQLMRLILVEQIYRAFKIINHETYHK